MPANLFALRSLHQSAPATPKSPSVVASPPVVAVAPDALFSVGNPVSQALPRSQSNNHSSFRMPLRK